MIVEMATGIILHETHWLQLTKYILCSYNVTYSGSIYRGVNKEEKLFYKPEPVRHRWHYW